MNQVVYSVDPGSLVVCPYENCRMIMLNTPRYVSRTRALKYAQSSTHHVVSKPAKIKPKWKNSKMKQMHGNAPNEISNPNGHHAYDQAANYMASQASSYATKEVPNHLANQASNYAGTPAPSYAFNPSPNHTASHPRQTSKSAGK